MQKKFAVFIVFLAAGCAAQLDLAPAKTFPEQVAYAEATAQGTIKTLADLTCRKYVAGKCAEAGRPLHPARSTIYLDQVENARTAAKQAGVLAAAGKAGNCLGQVVEPLDCLRMAESMLNEITKILTDVQKGK